MQKPKLLIKKETIQYKIARREAKEEGVDIEMAKQAEKNKLCLFSEGNGLLNIKVKNPDY